MHPVVDEALAIIPPPSKPSLDGFVLNGLTRSGVGPLLVADESVVIPYRIYSPEPAAAARQKLSDDAAVVLACAYSRHNDGFVRERALRQFVLEDRRWIVPFVIQLLGEYVPEIAEVVVDALADVSRPTYEQFGADNPDFVKQTQQHAISYWAEFYGGRYLFGDYPPIRAMLGLGLWRGPAGRRRLARWRRLNSD